MNLSEEARKARAEYLRQWRKKTNYKRDPEKIKEYQRRYWEKKAQSEQQ